MTKVNHLNPIAALNVPTAPVAAKGLPPRQISPAIISQATIVKANTPSLATKTVKTKAKFENNTQTFWKVAAIVTLAVSSLFLWQFFRVDVAIVKNYPNPFADPICLKSDESLRNMCLINDVAQSRVDAALRHIPNPFADPICLKSDENLRNMCLINDVTPSKVDVAIRNIPNPFADPICLKSDESLRNMCFENDLEEVVICSGMDKLKIYIHRDAKDKNIIDDFSKKYRLTFNKCFPFVGISGDRAQAITASSALAEDFANAGKYDEAFLVIHQANPNSVLRIKNLDMPTQEKLLSLLKLIAIKSKTFPIQFLALEKMHSVGESYWRDSELRQSLWSIRFSVSEELFKKGLFHESLQLLTEMPDKNNQNAERNLAKKIAIASTDENVRLKALNHKKYSENPFPICIEIAESLFKQGKINEAFNVLDMAFNELNHPEVYALVRVKGTEALYASLDKVIEVLVAKKEIALAQNIVDRLIAPGSKYRLWDQEKMDTLVGHVKQGAV